MKIGWRMKMALLLVFVMITGSAYGQHIFQMQAYNLPIEVLSQDVFEARFGNNPDIPRSDQAIIAMAERLYPSLAVKAQPAAQPVKLEEKCGEEDVGILFAALKNPEISDVTRTVVNDIIAAAIPALPKSKISDSGHFKFFYTSNDPDPNNNVTDAQIDNVAALMDSWWNSFATNFKDPKYKLVNGKKRIDIWVYYSTEWRGRTHSTWDRIELDSETVKDACLIKTTSAHELFHRVQYAYGFISGTANMGWMTEGTAAWSQKFTNQSIRDYMEDMNNGLGSPGTALITGRKYDACHFWTYLQEQADASAIKQVWAKYQANGLKAKEAAGSVTTARLALNFDKFAAKWARTNYMKNLTNAITGGYDYDENAVTKTSCGVAYGPLKKVPVTAGTINPDSSYSQAGSVTPYGAKYHVFTIGNTLKGLAVNFKGTGSFEVAFIGIKSNAWKSIDKTAAIKYGYKKTLTAGQWDKLAVVVMGTTTGGNYTLNVGGCIAGTWTAYGTWELKENGSSITGTMSHATCGLINVTGTYNAPNIILNTGIVVSGCCSVRWEGTVTDCKTISGTWTRTGGGSACTGTGSFTMAKQTSASAESSSAIENGVDPACSMCNMNNLKRD